MLLMLGENEDIVQVGETKSSPHAMSSMKNCDVWTALHGPKDMKGNCNRPNGMVMVAFCISLGWMGGFFIWFVRLLALRPLVAYCASLG
jgi:hypothetical protein